MLRALYTAVADAMSTPDDAEVRGAVLALVFAHPQPRKLGEVVLLQQVDHGDQREPLAVSEARHEGDEASDQGCVRVGRGGVQSAE